jgi:two-component system response regulator AtoC
MDSSYFALLVHDRPYPLGALKHALNPLSVQTLSVRTCEELKRLILQEHPHIILSDTSLPDGTWEDVVNLAKNSPVAANVIVVGANDDMKLYVSVLERGAFDFVVPPFEHQSLDFVVMSAGRNASLRRQTLVVAAGS